MGSSTTILSPTVFSSKTCKIPYPADGLTRSADSYATVLDGAGFAFAGSNGTASSNGGMVHLDQSVNGLSHDVRNMLSALNLYCDLLAEPEVLNPSYRHYADDLRLVAQAGTTLLERLARSATLPPGQLFSTQTASIAKHGEVIAARAGVQSGVLASVDSGVCEAERFTMASDLDRFHKLLSALAGPSFHVALECGAYAGPLPLKNEDLTRILINLVRNASEAMPHGGAIRINVQLCADALSSNRTSLMLSVEDDGPGIPTEDLPHVFTSGYTTKRSIQGKTSWLTPQLHGLGLSIVRELVETAGGMIQVSSPSGTGARFEITFPMAAALSLPQKQ